MPEPPLHTLPWCRWGHAAPVLPRLPGDAQTTTAPGRPGRDSKGLSVSRAESKGQRRTAVYGTLVIPPPPPGRSCWRFPCLYPWQPRGACPHSNRAGWQRSVPSLLPKDLRAPVPKSRSASRGQLLCPWESENCWLRGWRGSCGAGLGWQVLVARSCCVRDAGAAVCGWGRNHRGVFRAPASTWALEVRRHLQHGLLNPAARQRCFEGERQHRDPRSDPGAAREMSQRIPETTRAAKCSSHGTATVSSSARRPRPAVRAFPLIRHIRQFPF